MFSKSCEYGLRASLFIAEQTLNGSKVGLKDIASAIDSPTAFTAKILQILTKNNFVSVVKGPYGGFYMEDDLMNNKPVKYIVELFDGDKIYSGCALGLKECNENKPCPMHDQVKSIRNDLNKMLENNTIKDLLQSGDTNQKLWLKV